MTRPTRFARGFTLRLPLASLTESRFRSPNFFSPSLGACSQATRPTPSVSLSVPSFSLGKTQIAPIFYMRLVETDIKFSSLDVGKKGLFVFDIVCGTLNDQLSGGKHKQNI